MHFTSQASHYQKTIPSQTVEDRKTYNLAMSYLTSVESPPPVRVQGIELIQSLISARSSILDIPALLILFASLLQDSERIRLSSGYQVLYRPFENSP